MSSWAFRAGLMAWWADEPEPSPDDREGRKGWRQAALSAQDGPTALFNVYRREYPAGFACQHVFVGQVLAANQRDARTAALVCWPQLRGVGLDTRRAGQDQFEGLPR